MTTATIDAERALTPEGFEEAQRETIGSEIEVFPMRSWWPSALGHPCDRHLTWRWTRHQEQTAHGWVLQSIFDEGKLHQPDVYRRLGDMGFDIVREQDRPVQYKPVANAVISGRPDGRVVGFRGERYAPSLLLEIKSAQGHVFQRLRTFEDITNSRDHIIRGYADQGILGCFLENVPRGLIVIKSKATGVLKPIPFGLDYARAEWLLKRVERLQPMVEKEIDPEPIPYEPTVCGRCPFQRRCWPARSFGEGASVLDDPALVDLLEECEQTKPDHQRYERAWNGVKARLKHEGVAMAIIGPFMVEAHQRPMPDYQVKARVDTIFDIRRLP